MRPEIIPSLQNGNVISVIPGQYHIGALTGDGKLFTWGSYEEGSLGLGDPFTIEVGEPGGFATLKDKNEAERGRRYGITQFSIPRVTVPTEVKFNQRNSNGDQQNMFCVAATANRWKTGILAINLDAIVPRI